MTKDTQNPGPGVKGPYLRLTHVKGHSPLVSIVGRSGVAYTLKANFTNDEGGHEAALEYAVEFAKDFELELVKGKGYI